MPQASKPRIETKVRTLEGMNFTKPEPYIKEILEFLNSVTIVKDTLFQKT